MSKRASDRIDSKVRNVRSRKDVRFTSTSHGDGTTSLILSSGEKRHGIRIESGCVFCCDLDGNETPLPSNEIVTGVDSDDTEGEGLIIKTAAGYIIAFVQQEFLDGGYMGFRRLLRQSPKIERPFESCLQTSVQAAAEKLCDLDMDPAQDIDEIGDDEGDDEGDEEGDDEGDDEGDNDGDDEA